MNRSKLLISSVLILVLIFIGLVFLQWFKNQNLQVEKGWVNEWSPFGTYALMSLPQCNVVDDFYKDQTSPRYKYTLSSNSINIENYIFKQVNISGKVKEISKILKPPEIVCKKSPCEDKIVERIMNVEKIEIDHSPLSACQESYLDSLAKSPRKYTN